MTAYADLIKLDEPRMRRFCERGYTIRQVVMETGCLESTARMRASSLGLSFRHEHSPRVTMSRTLIDNALTAAFRSVIGWCPVRDGTPRDARFAKGPGKWVAPDELRNPAFVPAKRITQIEHHWTVLQEAA